MVCTCPHILLLNSTNESVTAVNIKNRFTFLDPPEALANVIDTIPVPMKVQRMSEEKRNYNLFYDANKAGRYLLKKWNEKRPLGTDSMESSDESDLDERINQNDDVDSLISSSECIEAENEVIDVIQPQPAAPVQSISSIPTGLYGRSSSNVSKYIDLRVRTNPHYAIPEPSSTV